MKYKDLVVLIPAIFLSILPTGCMKEDTTDCDYEGNFTLWFTYPDETGRDLFAAHIESVGIYVFDENHDFVTALYADRSQFQETQGLLLILDPGDYYIVGWGNQTETATYPSLPVGHTIHDSYFVCDPLTGPFFYAPAIPFTGGIEEADFFKITVPREGTAEATLPFMDATRPVHITITGLEDYLEEQQVGPVVEVTTLPEGYDFCLAHLPDKTTYTKKAGMEDENTSLVTFYTPFFAITEDVDIHLYRQSDESHIYTVNLHTVLQNLEEMPGATEALEIEIKFYTGGITITVNGWEEGELLTPDL